ncbi:MAG: hypothetical protein GXC73_13555 [Chitinophagaceae bacterium]|nr:hypothetical protein [Chitinophagaceae bacterium]
MKSKKQLKEELHQFIDSIDDEQVLQTLNEDIVPYVAKNDAESLTAQQQQELEEAITAADNGETVSFDEFKASMDKWRTAYKSTGVSK